MMYFAVAVGILFISFWLSQLIFVRLHLKWSDTILKADDSDTAGVSIIHPIKDLDYEFEKNLESWMNQDYNGPVEHIFSFQEPDDPAIEAVKRVMEKYPQIDMTIIVNPVMPGLNGKSSNMVHGVGISKYDLLLFGDSDVRVKQDFIIKMVRPLRDEKVGMTTCGQVNIGGTDFWTRFFTFLQNNETDFLWAFFTKIGMDLGATGAAFAMRKKLLREVGGLEAFGSSLLEDMHLGNTLFKMGYKLELGPFIECHVDKLAREKSFNYAKRIGVGIKTHIAVELPTFVIMLFWYYIFFIMALIMQDPDLLLLSLGFMAVRVLHAAAMRIITRNRVLPVDLIMGLFFDVFGTFYLLYSLNNPFVTWRGIKYEVKAGGFIEDIALGEEIIKEKEAFGDDD